MIYKRNNRKISQQLRINIMDPVVLVFGRYNFYNPSQLLLHLALPTTLQWTSFITSLPSLDSHSPRQTSQRSRMDFIQHFLSLKPEVLFKTVNHTPPTTLLIMLIAICVIVLIMMVIFIIGVCQLCKTTPSISESDESVTLVETPV